MFFEDGLLSSQGFWLVVLIAGGIGGYVFNRVEKNDGAGWALIFGATSALIGSLLVILVLQGIANYQTDPAMRQAVQVTGGVLAAGLITIVVIRILGRRRL